MTTRCEAGMLFDNRTASRLCLLRKGHSGDHRTIFRGIEYLWPDRDHREPDGRQSDCRPRDQRDRAQPRKPTT